MFKRLSGLFRKRCDRAYRAHMTRLSVRQFTLRVCARTLALPGRGREAHRRRRRGRRPAETDHSSPGQLFTHGRTEPLQQPAAARTSPHQSLPSVRPSARPPLSDRPAAPPSRIPAAAARTNGRSESGGRTDGRGRLVRAGAAAAAAEALCAGHCRRRRRSRKKSFLQFSVRCASVAGGLLLLRFAQCWCENRAKRGRGIKGLHRPPLGGRETRNKATPLCPFSCANPKQTVEEIRLSAVFCGRRKCPRLRSSRRTVQESASLLEVRKRRKFKRSVVFALSDRV